MANDQQKTIDTNVQDGELVQNVGGAQANKQWIALLVVLIVSLAATAWVFLQQKQHYQQSGADVEALVSSNQSLQSELSQTQDQLRSFQKNQQEMNKKLADLLAKQQYSSTELLAEWSRREVEFLLNVANQRAVLAKDIKGARAALKMADEKIQQMADYRLHPLRAIIAEEQMALDSVASVDIAGMGIQLQTAVNNVDKLRIKKGPEVAVATAAEASPAEAQSAWKQAAADIWQQVRSLVVIRHDETGEAAVLVPEQRYFLYQNLKLQLESARLSLLSADSEGYRHSIETAVDWLQNHFVGEQRDAMLTTLTAMQNQSINITVPDISESLNWLKEYQQ